MFRILFVLSAATLVPACQSTTVSSFDGAYDGSAVQFQVTEPLLDTPPLTTPQDLNFGSLINGIRIAGQGDVLFDDRLNEAAQKHAQDMVDNDYFSHYSQDGRAPVDRIRAEGYEPVISGENLIQGQQSDAAVVAAWQTSESHNALMLRDDMEDFALGVAGQGADTRWVLLMATEADAP